MKRLAVVLLAALALAPACGSRPAGVQQAITAARFACELYPYGPSEARTPEADAICPLLAPDAFAAADAGNAGAGGAP